MRKFKCVRCGSQEAAYQKYVKCVNHVNLENQSIVYEEGQFNEDDHLPVEYGYVCRDCGLQLRHAGRWIQTEQDLIRYLAIDLAILMEEERLYEAYAAAMAEQQDTEEE